MKLAVIRERRDAEKRVAATPETIKKLKALGFDITVEAGAGLAASISDDAYGDAGATVAPDLKSAVADADLIRSGP